MRPRAALRWVASRVPPPLLRVVRYPREFAFVNGWGAFDRPGASVVFLTVQKCASMLMRSLLAQVNRRYLGLSYLDLAGYLWDVTERPVYQHISAHAGELLRETGICYAPFRSYVDVSHLRRARVLGMVRDPRDVVVSGYFSSRYSHRAPANARRRQAFLEQRAALEHTTLDDYALAYAQRLQPVYELYRTRLDRSRMLTYEEMWSGFPAWLARLGQLLEVDFTPQDAERFRALAGVDRTGGEQVREHRRKGTPGDYRDKLSPAVAGRITDLFSDSLKWLYG